MLVLKKYGITIKSDQLIRHLSNLWAAFCNNGKPLAPSDFLNGSLLKQIAGFLQINWSDIKTLIDNIAKILQVHTILFQKQYFSLDGFFLIVTWLFAGKFWSKSHPVLGFVIE